MEDANWLVDPSRRGTLTGAPAEVTEADKKVLRDLGERLAAIAALPGHAETASNWRAMNGLKHVKPMVWIDEVPWHEMDVDDELRLQTTSEWSRYHEWEMRKLIYQWEHMPADMVVEPVVWSPLVVHNTAFGIAEDVDIAVTDEANSVVSRHFNIQIRDEDDLEKIKVPVVTHDAAASEEQYEQLCGDHGRGRRGQQARGEWVLFLVRALGRDDQVVGRPGGHGGPLRPSRVRPQGHRQARERLLQPCSTSSKSRTC